MQAESPSFREFLTFAPLRVIDGILLRWRMERQQPPPSHEFTLGNDQWTILFDNAVVTLRCEENAVIKNDLDVKAERASNELAVAVRHHKAASEAFASESGPLGNPANASAFKAKAESLADTIERCEAVIAKARAYKTTVSSFSFAMEDIA